MVHIFVYIMVKYRSNQNVLQIEALFTENSSNAAFLLLFFQSKGSSHSEASDNSKIVC